MRTKYFVNFNLRNSNGIKLSLKLLFSNNFCANLFTK